jgi:hypothetical protein
MWTRGENLVGLLFTQSGHTFGRNLKSALVQLNPISSRVHAVSTSVKSNGSCDPPCSTPHKWGFVLGHAEELSGWMFERVKACLVYGLLLFEQRERIVNCRVDERGLYEHVLCDGRRYGLRRRLCLVVSVCRSS